MAPRVGLEPTTLWLTVICSTDWANEEYSLFSYPFSEYILLKNKAAVLTTTASPFCSGNVLLSRAVSHQVPSALKSLTSVFGMGTGGSSSPSSPDSLSLINSTMQKIFHLTHFSSFCFLRSSPRPISINQLNVSPHLHLWPINHIVYVGSYLLAQWEILSWGGLHA